jgi:Putative polyhydroxyalkanoic acid system protein (PHA_gran_rgn)
MKHTVPHDLGRAKAKRVAEAAWGSYSGRFASYNPTCEWHGEYAANIGFKVKGISLKGAIDVGETEIGLDLDVPFLLRPFKGQALQVIEEEIRKWIGKSKAGEI